MTTKKTTKKNGKRKTAKKTTDAKRCVSPRSGNELVSGNPGNSGGKKGRSGRKPNWWKDFCGDTLKKPATKKALEDKAKAGDINAIKLLAEYAEGKPVQRVEGSLTISHEEALDELE